MTATDFRTKGTILRIEAGRAVFQPEGTSYEHHLQAVSVVPGRFIRAAVRVKARKIYGVGSGGNFVVPVLGTPRIIQGRVVAGDANTITVRAGTHFIVELPTANDSVDLHHGAIEVGSLVNVVVLPGAALVV